MGKTQIITGVERRRKFKDEEKAALVAEAETSTLSAVARKHGISPSILHVWKKKFPPKSFALVEVSEPGSKPSNPVVRTTSLFPALKTVA
jgi:transposase